MTFDKSNKTQAYHLRPLGQFSLILSRLELEYHSYQKCTLPVKLKNLAVKLWIKFLILFNLLTILTIILKELRSTVFIIKSFVIYIMKISLFFSLYKKT